MFRGTHCSPPRNISGYNEINLKLLAAHNYWLSLPVTDDDAANAHGLLARQSSLVVTDSGAISPPSVISSTGTGAPSQLAPVGPIWPSSSRSAAGCEGRVIEPDVAPRYQRRYGMRWRPDGRHRADFRIGTNKLRRRSNAGTRPSKRRRRRQSHPPREGHPEKQRPRSWRSGGAGDISRG